VGVGEDSGDLSRHSSARGGTEPEARRAKTGALAETDKANLAQREIASSRQGGIRKDNSGDILVSFVKSLANNARLGGLQPATA